jgi:hypothetical protein
LIVAASCRAEGLMIVGYDPSVLSGTKVRRFAEYWQSLRTGDRLPSRRDLDPAAFVFCLPNVLLMDLTHSPLRVRYRLVGTAVVAISKLDFTGRYLDELSFPNPHFDWTAVYRKLVDDRQPLYGSVPLESTLGERRYDLGLFPLSGDGETIEKAIAVEDYDSVGGWLEYANVADARVTGENDRR